MLFPHAVNAVEVSIRPAGTRESLRAARLWESPSELLQESAHAKRPAPGVPRRAPRSPLAMLHMVTGTAVRAGGARVTAQQLVKTQ